MAGAFLAAFIASILWYELLFCKTRPVYATAVVERGDIERSIEATGVLQPIKYVDVGSHVSGRVKSLKVKCGDLVTENQLLAEIDSVPANTELIAANAILENLTSRRSVEQAQLMSAKLKTSCNGVLCSGKKMSDVECNILRINYDIMSADIASLSVQIKQALSVVERAKVNLENTLITAPMAGEVVSMSIMEGQILNVNKNIPDVLRIADTTAFTVWVQIPEADILRVKIGQNAYFTVLGHSKSWNGKIRQVLPTPELIDNAVFYNVLFDVPNIEHELRIQMTARVSLVLEQVKDTLLIPVSAIDHVSGSPEIEVQVLQANGRVEPRFIRIGIKNGISAEIKSGVKEKDKIVISE